MLENYFSAPKTLTRLRAGLSGPHIDTFADALEQDGYSHGCVLRYLRAAAHLGQFLQRRRSGLADIDASVLDSFRRHLSRCRCPLSNGGKVNHHVFFGAKRFHAHLFQRERDYFCGGSRIQPLSFSRLITNSSSVAEGITCWRCFS